MDAETVKILLAVAGGAGAVKIIDKLIDFGKFVRGGDKPVFNGQTTLITKILEQQTRILEDIREVNKDNGTKLDRIGGDLVLAMGRQTDFYTEQRRKG